MSSLGHSTLIINLPEFPENKLVATDVKLNIHCNMNDYKTLEVILSNFLQVSIFLEFKIIW
jgi:hypothetical protein